MHNQMETVFVIYDESFQTEVSALIESDMVIARYTRVDGVVGARMADREERSGYLADRSNRIIIAIAESPTIAKLVANLRELRAQKGHGLRAFVVPVSEVI